MEGKIQHHPVNSKSYDVSLCIIPMDYGEMLWMEIVYTLTNNVHTVTCRTMIMFIFTEDKSPLVRWEKACDAWGSKNCHTKWTRPWVPLGKEALERAKKTTSSPSVCSVLICLHSHELSVRAEWCWEVSCMTRPYAVTLWVYNNSNPAFSAPIFIWEECIEALR